MRKKMYGILFGIILVLLAFGIYISVAYKLEPAPSKAYPLSKWTLKTEDTGATKEIELPYSFAFQGNYRYTLTTKLDDQKIGTDPLYLFVSMHHSYFKVFVENQEIYSYTEEETPNLSKSPGNIYTAVALPNDYMGKELRIEFTLTLEKGLTYVVSDLYLSDYPAEIHRMYTNDLIHNSIIIAILLLGIVLVFISIFVLKSDADNDAFFIGLFAFLVGLYGLTESLFNLHMLGNPYLSYLINFIVFAAIPAPILAFYKSKTALRFRKYYSIGLTLATVNVVMQMLLHFTGIADIRETLISTHVIYLLSFILVIVSVARSRKEECADKKLLISLILPIAIGAAADALMHYVFIGISERNTAFSQLGVLVTLLIASGYLAKNIMLAYRENLKAQTYKQMAFKDGLTGLYNRTSYNEEILLLSKNPKDNEELICVCVDINGLKKVNDSCGHLMGDYIIKQMGSVLETTFGKYGKVFRIGGDEFTAFLYNLEEDTLKEILCSMYQKVEQHNKVHTPELSFALGYELLKNIDSRDIKECFGRADMKMYTQKQETKSNNII